MSPTFIRYYSFVVITVLILVVIEALCCRHVAAKEMFVYDINVLNAKAATAIMTYKHDNYKDKKVLKLFGILETKGNWKEIYPLYDQMVSIVDKNAFPIQSSMDFNRRKKKQVFSLSFGSRRIKGTKKVDDQKERAILRRMSVPTHDLLSWVNYLRTFELKLGKPFNFRIFSGNRFYKVTAVPTKIEDVWVRSGLIPAYKIEASISSFRKRKKFNKKAEVWISADEEKLPLQMIFNLTLGEIRVILTDIK